MPEKASPSPTLMGVFAHPDDESLLAGGVLAQHAAAKARTTVVTMTWAPETPRATELADALQALGAGAPRMLGDGDERLMPIPNFGCDRVSVMTTAG